MKGKIVWLLVSCLIVVALLLASCAPAAVEEEEVAAPEEEVVTREERAPPEREVVTREEEKAPPPASTPASILAGLSEYTGPYPAPSTVSFTDNGQPVDVTAYPGQVLVFFSTPIPEADAQSLIETSGGTILAKIPMVGYYLIGVSSGAEGAFISAIAPDSRVHLAVPHICASLATGITVLDGCHLDHGGWVREVITDNGGSIDECRDIMTWENKVSNDIIMMAITKEAAENGGGQTTLLNLSAAGGLTDCSYAERSEAEQRLAENDWKYNMRITLEMIACLHPSDRENLVITICAGNGNMPLAHSLEEIRKDPTMADILRDNVLIVSTEMCKANYAPGDPDVAIVNNPEARGGSSFAAPYAMVIIQKLMAEKGLSSKEALQAVKAVMKANANQHLDEFLDELCPPPTATVTPTPTPEAEPGEGGSDTWYGTITVNCAGTGSNCNILGDGYDIMFMESGSTLELTFTPGLTTGASEFNIVGTYISRMNVTEAYLPFQSEECVIDTRQEVQTVSIQTTGYADGNLVTFDAILSDFVTYRFTGIRTGDSLTGTIEVIASPEWALFVIGETSFSLTKR